MCGEFVGFRESLMDWYHSMEGPGKMWGQAKDQGWMGRAYSVSAAEIWSILLWTSFFHTDSKPSRKSIFKLSLLDTGLRT